MNWIELKVRILDGFNLLFLHDWIWWDETFYAIAKIDASSYSNLDGHGIDLLDKSPLSSFAGYINVFDVSLYVLEWPLEGEL